MSLPEPLPYQPLDPHQKALLECGKMSLGELSEIIRKQFKIGSVQLVLEEDGVWQAVLDGGLAYGFGTTIGYALREAFDEWVSEMNCRR